MTSPIWYSVRVNVLRRPDFERLAHLAKIGEIPDEAAQRGGHMPDQRRRGDDVVLQDQGGIMLHVDDVQVHPAAEFLLAETAGVLDGVQGVR